MNCDERRDLLVLYVAGELEAGERAELAAHLATGCEQCAQSLVEAEAVLGVMAGAVTPIAPPPAAAGKLMKRIAGVRGVRAQRGAPVAGPSNWKIFAASALSAAAAIAITVGSFLYATRDERQFWKSSDLATVSLKSETQPGAHGQVWWDRQHGQWRVTVSKLAALPSGKEYELWLIPAGAKPVRSKTFKVDENGEAMLVINVPPQVVPAVAAITDEPAGGTDSPTGKIHLVGQFQ